MYGSEVWCIYDKGDYNSCEKDVIERKKSIFLYKQVLGQAIINNVQMQSVEVNLVVCL